jgi:Dolichyl-phosphate-mannose-protein mannosyltransferase
LWGIGYGLPCTYCRPDEDRLISTALRLSLADPNPHYFIWPGLFFYLTRGILEVATQGYRLLEGGFTGSSLDLYIADPAYFHLVMRYIFCGFGVATVYLIYRLGRELFSSFVGLLSAFFLGLTFLHVRDSHFAMLDIPATLLAVGIFLPFGYIVRRGRWRDYLWAGFLLGLATATKYYAVLLVIPLVTAHISRPGSPGGSAWRRLAVALFLAVAVFIAGSPYTLLDGPAFIREVKAEIFTSQYIEGFRLVSGLKAPRGWLYHIIFSFRYGLGWPLEIVSLLGVGYAAFRAARGKIPERLILSFVIPFYLVLSFQKSCFIRYTTLLLPFLCLLGAALLFRLLPRNRFRVILAVAAALAVVLDPAVRVIQLDRLLSLPDTRLSAGEWMRDNISPKSGVIFPQSMIFGWPDGFFFYPNRIALPAGSGPGPLPSLLSAPVPKKKYIVISEHSLSYSRLDPEVKILLENESEGIYTIKGGGEGRQDVVYDPFDAFYVPLAGFAGVDFPGPKIRVFYMDSTQAR